MKRHVLALCPDINVPRGEVALKQPVDWKKFSGQSVRIVYESERYEPHLRAALAHDCDVELLDAGQVDLRYVSYDKRSHRTFKKKHGMAIAKPLLHNMHPLWALWALREYRSL